MSEKREKQVELNSLEQFLKLLQSTEDDSQKINNLIQKCVKVEVDDVLFAKLIKGSTIFKLLAKEKSQKGNLTLISSFNSIKIEGTYFTISLQVYCDKEQQQNLLNLADQKVKNGEV